MDKKTALYIGISIIVLGVGFFIYKKIKAKRKYEMGELDNKSGQGSNYDNSSNSSNSSNNSNSSNSSSFDPKPHAEALRDAMKGFGTDDDRFWGTTNSLSKDEREKVKDYFNKNIGDLKDWIEGDFDWGDEDRALQIWGY